MEVTTSSTLCLQPRDCSLCYTDELSQLAGKDRSNFNNAFCACSRTQNLVFPVLIMFLSSIWTEASWLVERLASNGRCWFCRLLFNCCFVFAALSYSCDSCTTKHFLASNKWGYFRNAALRSVLASLNFVCLVTSTLKQKKSLQSKVQPSQLSRVPPDNKEQSERRLTKQRLVCKSMKSNLTVWH